MKKLALILLISIYTTATFGIGIKQFYCCGKLKSVTIAFVEGASNKCNKANRTEGCCKTKYQIFKIKDSHVAVGGISNLSKHSTVIYLFTPSFETVALMTVPIDIDIDKASHAPPIHNGIPIYVFNCVYRI